MIAIGAVLSMFSTSGPRFAPSRRRALLLGAAALLAGCAAETAPAGPRGASSALQEDAFVMSDGARLPLRVWLPAGRPRAVVLALHGFNDSRDAWEIPAPDFADAGMAIYSPDQRGFGEAPGRGLWAGGEALIDDAAEMARSAAAAAGIRHAKLIADGRKHGRRRADAPGAPGAERARPVAGYVMVAPAVWGRARDEPVFAHRRCGWPANLVPGMELSRPPPPVARDRQLNNHRRPFAAFPPIP